MSAPYVASCVFVWAIAAVLIFLYARRRRWSIAAQGTLAFYGGLVAVPVYLVAVVFGLLSPFEEVAAQWKVSSFQHALYLGETRVALESHFGRDVSKPDEVQDRNFYVYDAGGALCDGDFRGVAVTYDTHDRVKSWKPTDFTEHC